MKIITPGLLLWTPERGLHMDGWRFDGEGVCYETSAEMYRAAASAAVLHVARSCQLQGVAIAPPSAEPERMDLDSERAALDVIAVAGAGRVTAARQAWKAHHRLMRIAARESAKAAADALLFGTGFVRFHSDGTVQHVPLQQVQLTPPLKRWPEGYR